MRENELAIANVQTFKRTKKRLKFLSTKECWSIEPYHLCTVVYFPL